MSENNIVETELQDLAATELEMQELEALEAPGWATSAGVSVGISLVSVAFSLT
ncbi:MULTISPECIES: daptide-type RiPP [unclassified Streptomyces]|uniref:daptide-type RiPP n=1 Tax=unclassified Streptomyces TaxID=2593676 RepID=UPI00332023D1